MADNLEDTQPLPVVDPGALLGVDDAEVAEAKKKLPDSAVLRAALVGVLVFVGAAVGKPELAHTEWVDAIVSGYVFAAPVGLALWLRHQHKKS